MLFFFREVSASDSEESSEGESEADEEEVEDEEAEDVEEGEEEELTASSEVPFVAHDLNFFFKKEVSHMSVF